MNITEPSIMETHGTMSDHNKTFTEPQRNLTDDEWQEIVTLDFVLTHQYSDDIQTDLERYKELELKRWAEPTKKNH